MLVSTTAIGQGVLDHLQTLLPWISLGSFILWTIYYKTINDKILLSFVPSSIRAVIEEQKKTNPKFSRACRVNGTAFTHAIITVPLVLFALTDPRFKADPFHGESLRFNCIGAVMCGYFLWDICICVIEYQAFGIGFLGHAVVSFIGLYVHFTEATYRMVYLVTIFMGTEISTPILHLRWLCLKAGATNTLYFKCVNFLFISSFTIYRLVLTPIFCFYPFVADSMRPVDERVTRDLNSSRRLFYGVVLGLWSALNLFWAGAVLQSQMKQLSRKQTKKAA